MFPIAVRQLQDWEKCVQGYPFSGRTKQMTLQSSGDVLINRAEPGNFMAGIFCLADWELLQHNGVNEFINSNLKIEKNV